MGFLNRFAKNFKAAPIVNTVMLGAPAAATAAFDGVVDVMKKTATGGYLTEEEKTNPLGAMIKDNIGYNPNKKPAGTFTPATTPVQALKTMTSHVPGNPVIKTPVVAAGPTAKFRTSSVASKPVVQEQPLETLTVDRTMPSNVDIVNAPAESGGGYAYLGDKSNPENLITLKPGEQTAISGTYLTPDPNAPQASAATIYNTPRTTTYGDSSGVYELAPGQNPPDNRNWGDASLGALISNKVNRNNNNVASEIAGRTALAKHYGTADTVSMAKLPGELARNEADIGSINSGVKLAEAKAPYDIENIKSMIKDRTDTNAVRLRELIIKEKLTPYEIAEKEALIRYHGDLGAAAKANVTAKEGKGEITAKDMFDKSAANLNERLKGIDADTLLKPEQKAAAKRAATLAAGEDIAVLATAFTPDTSTTGSAKKAFDKKTHRNAQDGLTSKDPAVRAASQAWLDANTPSKQKRS